MIISALASSVLLIVATFFEQSNGEIMSLVQGDINERIKNGDDVTDRSQFAYDVHLSFTKIGKKGRKVSGDCSGSLIMPNWILTAGHCCNKALDVTAVFGTLSSSVSYGRQRKHRKRVGIKRLIPGSNIFMHENFDSVKHSNGDICLLKLKKNLKLNNDINLISLLDNGNKNPDNYAGQNATISGWGLYSDTEGESPVLKYGTVQIITLKECQELTERPVTETQICTTKDEYGTCKGDSGGPMIINGQDGNQQQIGIVSFGVGGHCESTEPTIYTYVPAFIDWINNTITKNS